MLLVLGLPVQLRIEAGTNPPELQVDLCPGRAISLQNNRYVVIPLIAMDRDRASKHRKLGVLARGHLEPRRVEDVERLLILLEGPQVSSESD